MKLHHKLRDFCCAALALALIGFLCCQPLLKSDHVFAETEAGQVVDGDAAQSASSRQAANFVTIYDGDTTYNLKTTAATVGEVIERAKIFLDAADKTEPSLETKITGNDYQINIYRARPSVVIDGTEQRYIMTASYDPAEIAREAGFTVYDGDEIAIEPNLNFLEAGAASVFRLHRHGGRTITLEESLPYATETRYDYSLAKGETRLERPGEDGRKKVVYEALFENNVEVLRTLVSEEILLEPVSEIVVVGAKASIPPEREQCANWAREAGVSEEDLLAALDLIYRESGCRVDATNPTSGAYGIPQALPATKLASMGDDWQTNPVLQIRWMANYVNTRYGGWQEALNFWWCIGQCSNKYGTINKVTTWY